MGDKNLSYVEMFKEELKELVEKTVHSSHKVLTEQEIKAIVQALLPDLDKMIANKIKEHSILIADFIKEKFENSANEE